MTKTRVQCYEKHFHLMPPISECASIALVMVSSLSSFCLLADETAPAGQWFALQWFLLPFVGALCSSVCAMLFNPRPEARKTVMARCIASVPCGTAIPKIASMVHPALKEIALDPAIIFLAGFVCAMLVYIISRSTVEKLYGQADVIAEDIVEGMQTHIKKRIEETTITKGHIETKVNVEDTNG